MYLDFKFGQANCEAFQTGEQLLVALANQDLGSALVESWDFPALQARQGNRFHWLEGQGFRIGACAVPVNPSNLQAQTQACYTELLAVCREQALYRIWNFVPQINEVPTGSIENYQVFCKGRSLAFEAQYGAGFDLKLPAASAVGTNGSHLLVVAVTGEGEALHLENPDQTPAYRYPATYGPRPPSFARATVCTKAGLPKLFISGTSSIRGSRSIGTSTTEQLSITLENLNKIEGAYLRQQATSVPYARRIRVYLRNPEDKAIVAEQLAQDYLKDRDEVFYLHADICRKELQIEIEVTLL
ncbi:hypothetical protein [Coraliomargarita parva]|uniref:chorismate transformation enzyme, FkbO/Hyg5 family n=1 Tax=Coraliomargarita parva TaxID=3014050 RepID=UPI0022B53DBE|nr:hypothetical protein [Coraliomargarita parva]